MGKGQKLFSVTPCADRYRQTKRGFRGSLFNPNPNRRRRLMKKLREETVPYNTGWAAQLKKGEVIRITATTTVDFVAFNLQNFKERFDQARTKVYNMKIFISTGDT